jgi:hypothetical protein
MRFLSGIGRAVYRVGVAVLRPFAVICLLIAALALASDMSRTSNGGVSGIARTPVAAHWKMIAPQSLANAQVAIQRMSHPLVWTGVVAPVLQLPTWLLFGGLGAGAALISRRRREVNVFVN